jgi:dTDP-4-amino-4,6-dideoxygalactose transaminase
MSSAEPAADDDLPAAIKLAEPDIGAREIAYVVAALKRPDELAYGEPVRKFEQTVLARVGGRHGVAVQSGTAALHLGLLAAGVTAGDDVLMPTLTFVAPANATRYIGAAPVFLDVDLAYRQLDATRLDAFLEANYVRRDGGAYHSTTGRRAAAVVPVDLLGHPVDLDEILRVAARHGVPVVQDAAEALGAELRGRPVGAGAPITCLSFNANKVATAGGGGMVVCDDERVARHIAYLARQAKDDHPHDAYVHSEVGFNYGMASPQAALGTAQVERLDELLAGKREVADGYDAGLGDVPGITLPQQAPWAKANNWLYTIHIDEGVFGRGRDALAQHLRRLQIQSRPIFTPLHLVPAHQDAVADDCRVAEELGNTGLTLPSSAQLSAADVARVCGAVRAAAA